MANILLIHGAAHGAWCWRDTIPELEALGHRVRAIDLPSHGKDDTPIEDVTLDLYAQSILDAIDEPTVVLGHSMGGYPISRAADLNPTFFERLIYLCAYVPKDNYSLAEMRKLAPRQPIMKAVKRSEDGVSMTFRPEHAREVFYQDCSDEAIAFALENLCVQATLPQGTKVTLGQAYKTLPRSYIVCRNDEAIPAELQDEMASDFEATDVYEMATSHSPFLSDPKGLAQLVDKILKRPD